MDDPLPATADPVQFDAVLGAVPLQGGEHLLRQGIGERTGLIGGGNDVIDGGDRSIRATHGQALVPQGSKSLGAGDLMDQMQTHEQLGGSSGKLRHPVQIPHLVVEGAGTQQLSRSSKKPYPRTIPGRAASAGDHRAPGSHSVAAPPDDRADLRTAQPRPGSHQGPPQPDAPVPQACPALHHPVRRSR